MYSCMYDRSKIFVKRRIDRDFIAISRCIERIQILAKYVFLFLNGFYIDRKFLILVSFHSLISNEQSVYTLFFIRNLPQGLVLKVPYL